MYTCIYCNCDSNAPSSVCDIAAFKLLIVEDCLTHYTHVENIY